MIQDMEMLLNFPDGGISGDSTLIMQVTGLVNQAYLKTIAYVLGLDPRWVWDDSNYGTLPIATATLVNNQEDYYLPGAEDSSTNASTFLRLLKVSVKDNAGQETVIKHTDMSEAELNRMYTTSGVPEYYKLYGNTLKLFPAPATGSVTLTNGLKCYFQRSPDLFSSDGPTQIPGIPEPFHRMITLEASMDYASARGLPNLEYLQGKLAELKTILDGFFPKNADAKIKLTARRESYL
jgi:hypothetical protein